jgi:signal transduction histidine kinase
LTPDSNEDKRLVAILDMIGRMAALDFSIVLPSGGNNDMIDAISLGLNMLSEELNSNVVAKSKLDRVNQKLEKFAHVTAHDLKSPLNSLFGLIALFEMSLNGKEKDTRSDTYLYLSKMKQTTEKMKNLVHEILDYSKMDATELTSEKIDLNHVLTDILETNQSLSPKCIEIIGPLPVVYFNKSAIHQVVQNLLTNAFKYSEKENCRIIIQSHEDEQQFIISISDNGIGIAKENLEKIFELFYKVDLSDSNNSHGIGLATVKNIIESAGEKIWVESELGKGSTFYFTLKNIPNCE